MFKRFYAAALPLSAALLVVVGSILVTGCSKKSEVADEARPVRAITLGAAQQQLMAEYSGNVQTKIESRLGFRVGGKIQTRKVDVGTLVKPGQILMQLDPQDLQLAQAQAQANLKAAQSNFELANVEFKRYDALRATNAISQSMMDAKAAALDSAKAAFEQAQAAAKGQANQTAYANLVSDVEGVVTAINAEVGQVVAAGAPVVQVAKVSNKQDGELEVAVGIPENSVDIVNRANQIHIKLWANGKETLNGKIREMSPVADAATRTFIAKVSIVNPTPNQMALVKLGMTASVQFLVETPNAFLKVPLTALYQEKGVTSVWIVEKDVVKLVPVQIAGVSGNDILLASGVSVGQTIVTAGVHVLNPGQHVTIMPPETKAVSSEPFLTTQSVMSPQAGIKPVDAKGVK